MRYSFIPGDGWRIFKTEDHWWDLPYLVLSPNDNIITNKATLQGAKRAIAKEKYKLAHPEIKHKAKWWESPIVYRED